MDIPEELDFNTMNTMEVRRLFTDGTHEVVRLRTTGPRPAATNRVWRGETVFLWPDEEPSTPTPPAQSSELESGESDAHKGSARSQQSHWSVQGHTAGWQPGVVP
eukprot:5701267-Lingulodinium_polyedra.AAC.1